jgi:hypothetical protein
VNAARDKRAILQVFLNISEQPRCYGSAFTRQRTLVRTQQRPPWKVLGFWVKLKDNCRSQICSWDDEQQHGVEEMTWAL